MDLVKAMRPEIGAGGYARDSSTVEFYVRVDALLPEAASILDFGAGRGTHVPEPPGIVHRLRNLKDRAALVAGVDIDPAVLDNPWLHEAHLIVPDRPLPYGEGTFDVVIADWVLEHVENVGHAEREIHRVLKPGGWFCARTPNRWGYIGIGARLTPPRVQARLLGHLQPHRSSEDIFPKHYRANTAGAIRRWFPDARWRNCTYPARSTPAYAGGSRLAFRAIDVFQKLAPGAMATLLMVFLQKR